MTSIQSTEVNEDHPAFQKVLRQALENMVGLQAEQIATQGKSLKSLITILSGLSEVEAMLGRLEGTYDLDCINAAYAAVSGSQNLKAVPNIRRWLSAGLLQAMQESFENLEGESLQ